MTTKNKPKNPLVISMGFNFYDKIYSRNIQTHIDYCKSNGFDYIFVNKPSQTPLKMESAWLKIPLIISAMKSNYNWIMYIDVDAKFQPNAPDFRILRSPGKDLFLSSGRSGRVNSGVIITRKTTYSQNFFYEVLSSAGMSLPAEDKVGWGENGEIIYFSKKYKRLKIVSGKWNNNKDPLLDDYIRHFSAGPLRHLFAMSEQEQIAKENHQKFKADVKTITHAGSRDFYQNLYSLFCEVRQCYPDFSEIDECAFTSALGSRPVNSDQPL